MWVDIKQLSKQQVRKLEYIIKGIKMPKIKVKVLNKECAPERTHRWDAGWDLKSTEDVTIPAGEMVKVHTGVITEIPPRHCGMVVPRSSFGVKHRLTLANDIGIIDTEYRGEIMVFITNDSDKDFTIKQYERFCQLLIVPINSSELWIVDNLSKTDRGSGGFGSTTVKPKIVDNLNIGLVEIDPILADDQKVNTEDLREAQLEELRSVKPAEYIKLKNTNKLFDKYPIATGDMKEDLGI